MFSDRHAIIEYAKFYNDINELDNLDWESIHEKIWGYVPDSSQNKEEKEAELPDIREKKHAEFLVYQKIELGMMHGIGVINTKQINAVQTIISQAAHQPKVKIKAEWYF